MPIRMRATPSILRRICSSMRVRAKMANVETMIKVSKIVHNRFQVTWFRNRQTMTADVVMASKPDSVVAVVAAVDDRAHATAHNLRGAVGATSQSTGMSSGGLDFTRHVQVADKGILDETERGDVVAAAVVVEGQRVSAAVESAVEGFCVITRGACSHHRRDADIGI